MFTMFLVVVTCKWHLKGLTLSIILFYVSDLKMVTSVSYVSSAIEDAEVYTLLLLILFGIESSWQMSSYVNCKVQIKAYVKHLRVWG